MLNYGCTRLEIGVQSVYEDIARDTNRYGYKCKVKALHNKLCVSGYKLEKEDEATFYYLLFINLGILLFGHGSN